MAIYLTAKQETSCFYDFNAGKRSTVSGRHDQTAKHTGYRLAIAIYACIVSIIAVLCAGPATARTLKDIRSSGKLIVSVSPDAPPFAYADHQDFVGIDIDLARELASRLGLVPSFVANANPGRPDPGADITMGVRSAKGSSPSESTVPYYTERLALVHNPSGADGHGDLNSPLGVVEGSSADKRLIAARTILPHTETMKFKTFAAALEAFRTNQVSRMLLNLSQAIVVARSAGRRVSIRDPGKFRFPRADWPVSLAVSADAPELFRKVSDVLMSDEASELIEKIYIIHGLPGKLAR